MYQDEEEGGSETAYRICHRLRTLGNEEALSDPSFEQLLNEHFERLPSSYADLMKRIDRAEEVLLHRRILAECQDPDKRTIFHARFLKTIQIRQEWPVPPGDATGGSMPSALRVDELQEHHPEKMTGDLCLERTDDLNDSEDFPARMDREILLHEIIFSSFERPKLLGQLSTLLSDVGLNIRQAHVFATIDGFCLAMFIVDGWEWEETDGLVQLLKHTAKRGRSSP